MRIARKAGVMFLLFLALSGAVSVQAAFAERRDCHQGGEHCEQMRCGKNGCD